ncbi:MAG: hypothetical protein GY866_03245 [Proteobacteria bacterium]|nr:hypothetical protein [Pseudomonadota bacterium]
MVGHGHSKRAPGSTRQRQGTRESGERKRPGIESKKALSLVESRRLNEAISQPTTQDFASGVFPCKDGYVTIMGGTIFFPKTAAMLEMPELLEHPVYSNFLEHAKPEVAEEFLEILLPWLLERTKKEVWEAAQTHNMLSSPVYSTEDLLGISDEEYELLEQEKHIGTEPVPEAF